MKKLIPIIAIIIILAIILFSYLYLKDRTDSSESMNQEVNEGIQDIFKMHITSPAFNNNEPIPSRYTCQGENINPPLEISEVPEGTQSFVLIMDDPDAPVGTWVHWIIYDIPSETTTIAENSIPKGARQGTNSWGKEEYGGPCPPSGTHHYHFKLYALDITDETKILRDKASVQEFMQNHIIEQAELTGTYSKN